MVTGFTVASLGHTQSYFSAGRRGSAPLHDYGCHQTRGHTTMGLLLGHGQNGIESRKGNTLGDTFGRKCPGPECTLGPPLERRGGLVWLCGSSCSLQTP